MKELCFMIIQAILKKRIMQTHITKILYLYLYASKIEVPYSTLSSPPPLSSPPVNLEESRSLKKISTKILCKKLYLWTYCELDLLIFVCFSYLNTIINNKTTLQLHFLYKSCKILENFENLKKKSPLSSPLTNLGKCWSFRED